MIIKKLKTKIVSYSIESVLRERESVYGGRIREQRKKILSVE